MRNYWKILFQIMIGFVMNAELDQSCRIERKGVFKIKEKLWFKMLTEDWRL